MIVLSSEKVRQIEKEYIDSFKINNNNLIECAVVGIMNNIDLSKNRYTFFCGSGNNGEDGLGVARCLAALKKDVTVFLCLNGKQNISYDYKNKVQILNDLGVNVININDNDNVDIFNEIMISSDIVFDSIFGSGINRELSYYYKNIIDNINKKCKNIISIDIPSGMDGSNGNIYGECIKAKKTLSIGFLKRGFYNSNNITYTGEVNVIPMYIPDMIIKRYDENIRITERKFISEIIPRRSFYENKGSFGKTTIVAGSEKYTGAAYLCTEASIKTGSGLVTLFTDKKIIGILQCKLAEAMISDKESNEFNDQIKKSDVIACGPGMGNTEDTLQTIKNIINNSTCPVVFDADALNVIAKNKGLLQGLKGKAILTPHPGEMSRLCKCGIEDINKNRIGYSVDLAKELNAVVVLKGYRTIITDGEKVYINTTGNSAMASGGMGDSLTGIISSLISQGMSPFYASIAGCYMHGSIADNLSDKMYCIDATTLIKEIPYELKKLTN